MAGKKRKRIELGDGAELAEGGLTHSPFAHWAAKSPEGSAEAQATESGAATSSEDRVAADSPSVAEGGTARIRHERKGHGGKTVTIVEFERSGSSMDLGGVARDLGKALGTRAREVAGTVVVQGDVRERVHRYLTDELGLRTSRGTG